MFRFFQNWKKFDVKIFLFLETIGTNIMFISLFSGIQSECIHLLVLLYHCIIIQIRSAYLYSNTITIGPAAIKLHNLSLRRKDTAVAYKV